MEDDEREPDTASRSHRRRQISRKKSMAEKKKIWFLRIRLRHFEPLRRRALGSLGAGGFGGVRGHRRSREEEAPAAAHQ